MRSFLVACALLAASFLAALSGLPEKPHATFLQSPTNPTGCNSPSTTAVAFQGASFLGNQTSVNPYVANVTTTTCANTGLVIAYVATGGIAPSAAPTFNTSTNCVHINDLFASAGFVVYQYFCPVGALTNGSYPISVSTSVSQTAAVCVWEYSGVAQVSATESITGSGGGTATSTSPATLTVTTVTDNDWGVGLATPAFGGGGITGAGGSYTQRTLSGCTSASNAVLIDSNAVVHPAGATTPTWIWPAGGGEVIMTGFGLKHG